MVGNVHHDAIDDQVIGSSTLLKRVQFAPPSRDSKIQLSVSLNKDAAVRPARRQGARVTAVGPDRPPLVEGLSQRLNGN